MKTQLAKRGAKAFFLEYVGGVSSRCISNGLDELG